MLKTLCIFGTRPEAIKMAPVIKELNLHKNIQNQVCLTGQHVEMINPILDLFDIVVDFKLDVMQNNQDLAELTAKILTGLCNIIKHNKPAMILVHGDTTSTLAASLAAFYHKVPLAHIEAGLRTGDVMSPWPEEANRSITSILTALHFAPTNLSKQNLLREGIDENKIYITGNTVIDALVTTCEKLKINTELATTVKNKFHFLKPERKIILVTGHRRENFGEGFKQICQALANIANLLPNVDIVYPVHLNPNVQQPIYKWLSGIKNIYLISPLDYISFVYLMKESYMILTDSGGIQEEAAALGKPVLVMREKSERREAIDTGAVMLVGNNVDNIINNVEKLLMDAELYQKMSNAKNPYGDGLSAKYIVNTICDKAQDLALNIDNTFNLSSEEQENIKTLATHLNYSNNSVNQRQTEFIEHEVI